MQAFNHAHRIRRTIHVCFLWPVFVWGGTLQHIALPGPRDHCTWSGSHRYSGSSLNVLQKLDGFQCRPPTWCGIKVKRAQQRGQKATHHKMAAQQFLCIGVIRWARQFSNCRDGCSQMLDRHTGIDALKQRRGVLRLIKNDLASEGEHLRCGVQVMDRTQAFLLSFPCGGRKGRLHESIKKI